MDSQLSDDVVRCFYPDSNSLRYNMHQRTALAYLANNEQTADSAGCTQYG